MNAPSPSAARGSDTTPGRRRDFAAGVSDDALDLPEREEEVFSVRGRA
jgi:hypothetical protein